MAMPIDSGGVLSIIDASVNALNVRCIAMVSVPASKELKIECTMWLRALLTV
jgi:hypothetical protein